MGVAACGGGVVPRGREVHGGAARVDHGSTAALADAGHMSSTPDVNRSLTARIAAHTKWARTVDRSTATAAARAAFDATFEREVDPQGALPPAERAKRVDHARRAYFHRLALMSARKRRARP